MSLQYKTGEIDDLAAAISGVVFERPFPGINVDYILKQRFMQPLINWEPTDLNTPHDDYADFLLVEESPLQDASAGLVTWERTYAKVPDTYSEPGGNYAYNFIGYFGAFGLNVTTATGRERFVRTVPMRIQRDFFLVDGDTIPTPFDIPVVEAQKYYSVDEDVEVDYLGDSDILANETTPSRTDYQAMIAAGDEIVAEDSRLTRWMGNIFMRETLYIKAR